MLELAHFVFEFPCNCTSLLRCLVPGRSHAPPILFLSRSAPFSPFKNQESMLQRL